MFLLRKLIPICLSSIYILPQKEGLILSFSSPFPTALMEHIKAHTENTIINEALTTMPSLAGIICNIRTTLSDLRSYSNTALLPTDIHRQYQPFSRQEWDHLALGSCFPRLLKPVITHLMDALSAYIKTQGEPIDTLKFNAVYRLYKLSSTESADVRWHQDHDPNSDFFPEYTIVLELRKDLGISSCLKLSIPSQNTSNTKATMTPYTYTETDEILYQVYHGVGFKNKDMMHKIYCFNRSESVGFREILILHAGHYASPA